MSPKPGWIPATIIGALLALGLAACGTTTGPGEPGFRIEEQTMQLKDGRTVTCLTYKTSINCDWDHAK
jgi:hypothetical protein